MSCNVYVSVMESGSTIANDWATWSFAETFCMMAEVLDMVIVPFVMS